MLGLLGWAVMVLSVAASASLLTWSATDPSFVRAAGGVTRNALGLVGANFSDLAMRLFGLASVFLVLPPIFWALQLITRRRLEEARTRLMLAPAAVLLLACATSALPRTAGWPLPYGLGGLLGDQTLRFLAKLLAATGPERAVAVAGVVCLAVGPLLLVTSLGMSFQDLRIIWRGDRRGPQPIARGWRWLARAPGHDGDAGFIRREPTFGMSSSPFATERQPPLPVEPAFDYEPPVGGHTRRPPSGKRVTLRRPVREPDFDRAIDTGCQDMARRFAPARDEPCPSSSFGRLGRRGTGPTERASPRRLQSGESLPEGTPVWPGSVPAPGAGDAAPVKPDRHDAGAEDELYGRAVGLVRAHGKASTAYLQQSLGIRYLRAANLLDRMEREGIVGAPVHNGVRPILGGSVR
ncbi:MAG: DNA translocase FtsK 4TM domain-containing protein, partial [Hyphomicrobiaceae bacterium]|nr:DNA translocase FtsK 4TM domain-containing protein [Hyphomicrobiaceae bacterium]